VTSSRLSWLLVSAYLVLSAVAMWTALDRGLWTWMVAAWISAGALVALIYWRGTPSLRTVLIVAVVVRIGWLAVPSGLSDDAFRYAWDGMLVVDGINPYEFVPADSALSAYRSIGPFEELNSGAFHSVYPPVTQYLFAGTSWLSQGDVSRFFYIWKTVLVLLEVLALFLLARTVSPGLLMLFAWNPAIVVSGAGQGHTDVLLALPLIAAVLLARRHRWNAAGALIAVMVLIKIWPAVVVPAFLRKKTAVLLGALAGAVLALPFAASFVLDNVGQSLDLYVRYFEFNAGPYYALKEGLRSLTGDDWSKQLGPFLRRLFLFGVAGIGILAWRRRPRLEDVLFYAYALFLVTATTVHPWYLYPLLLLGVLRGQEVWGWQWLSVLSLGTYLLYVDGPYWPFVVLGWVGCLVLGLIFGSKRWVRAALLNRARWKAEWADTYLRSEAGSLTSESGPILDLGGGEGYVASALTHLRNQPVTVLEVRDGRPDCESSSEYLLYDGATFPFADDSFSAAIAIFSLHHAKDPMACLRELRRTVAGEVVVIESVQIDRVSAWALRILDPLVNSLRGPWNADDQSPQFASPAQWRARFEEAGFHITGESIRYNLLHRKHLFCLLPGQKAL
jgi:alpha-1,6-mannosyltransferase